MSASDTGAGTVHAPRCMVGTRIAATAPSEPRSTTAVAPSPGPWFAVMTSVHVPSSGHERLSAYTPSRDVSVNASFTETDRKSTRLNSSHGYISYAVFCLKKKNKHTETKRKKSRQQPSKDTQLY